MRHGALELLLLLVRGGTLVDIARVCSLLLSLLHHLLLQPLLLQLLQTVSVGHRLLPLLFGRSLVRLHVDWDHECGKGVTTHDSSIIHYILWCDLHIFSIRISKCSLRLRPMCTCSRCDDLWLRREVICSTFVLNVHL